MRAPHRGHPGSTGVGVAKVSGLGGRPPDVPVEEVEEAMIQDRRRTVQVTRFASIQMRVLEKVPWNDATGPADKGSAKADEMLEVFAGRKNRRDTWKEVVNAVSTALEMARDSWAVMKPLDTCRSVVVQVRNLDLGLGKQRRHFLSALAHE